VPRTRLNSAEEVALGYDADKMTIAVYNRHPADLVQEHELRRLQDRCLRRN
jgi:hypothetical protein